MKWVLKYKGSLIGIGLGAIAGFLYWRYIGCLSGTCVITSKPLNSTLYGGLLGYLMVGLFKTGNTKKEEKPPV